MSDKKGLPTLTFEPQILLDHVHKKLKNQTICCYAQVLLEH